VLISRKQCKTEIYLQWKTNRKSYSSYRMTATAVTLNDLEGHSPVVGFFKRNLSNICAAFYTILKWQCACGPSALASLLYESGDTDKRIVYARNTKMHNNKMRKALFVNLRPLHMYTRYFKNIPEYRCVVV